MQSAEIAVPVTLKDITPLLTLIGQVMPCTPAASWLVKMMPCAYFLLTILDKLIYKE
jgi:hypothetical protein